MRTRSRLGATEQSGEDEALAVSYRAYSKRRQSQVRTRLTVFIGVLVFFLAASTANATDLILNNSPATVCFSPNSGCTNTIVKTLSAAKGEILIQAYSFTSPPIAKALLDAYKRGVSVKVILDKSQRTQKYSSADFLANNGIPTWIDAAHAIAHNKVMVIDGETIITGSFNFTKAAEERNAENLLIIKSKELASEYIKNWNNHLKHSEAYRGKLN